MTTSSASAVRATRAPPRTRTLGNTNTHLLASPARCAVCGTKWPPGLGPGAWPGTSPKNVPASPGSAAGLFCTGHHIRAGRPKLPDHADDHDRDALLTVRI